MSKIYDRDYRKVRTISRAEGGNWMWGMKYKGNGWFCLGYRINKENSLGPDYPRIDYDTTFEAMDEAERKAAKAAYRADERRRAAHDGTD